MVDLSDTERMIVDTVHEFVERDVRPYVRDIEHANEYPASMIDQMKELGIFGLAIPESMGGFRVSMPCYVQVTGTSPLPTDHGTATLRALVSAVRGEDEPVPVLDWRFVALVA